MPVSTIDQIIPFLTVCRQSAMNNFLRVKAPRSIYLFTISIILFIALNGVKVALFRRHITDGLIYLERNFVVATIALCGIMFLLLLRRKKPLWFVAAYILQVAYLSINLSYYSFFGSYLYTSQYLSLLPEGATLLAHMALPSDNRWYIYILDLIPAIGVVLWYRPLSIGRFKVAGNCAMIVCIAVVLWRFAHWNLPWDKLPLKLLDDPYTSELTLVREYGLLTFNVLDVMRWRNQKSLIRSMDYGPQMKSSGDTTGVRRNIIMIQVESLDANVVNMRWNGSYVTPFLHRLSTASRYFPYTLSYHNAGATTDCGFATINSVETFEHFPAIKLRDYPYENSMVKQFNAAGYSTAAFHANTGEYFNRRRAFKKMGFQTFYDMYDMKLREQGWGASDSGLFAFVNQKVQSASNPYFYYIITMSSHEPFTMVDEYFTTSRFDAIPDPVSRRYCTALAYVDSELEKFITTVRAVSPSTVVMIYGDHTPGIRHAWYKQAAFEVNHRNFEFVPLFIVAADCAPKAEHSRAVSFLDLSPTALIISGVPFAIQTYGVDVSGMSNGGSDDSAAVFNTTTIPSRGLRHSRSDLFTKAKHTQR